MTMIINNLMAFNPQYFRPQPMVNNKQDRTYEEDQSFQDILKEKMRANTRMIK
jgi:hypothetical protein